MKKATANNMICDENCNVCFHLTLCCKFSVKGHNKTLEKIEIIQIARKKYNYFFNK